jgi:hypothetical protein
MTQHYKDIENNVYGFKPKNIEVFEITIEEAREILSSKIDVRSVRIKEIETRLSEIDLLSLRPLRAIEAGSAVQYDHDKLVELDSESELLRDELRGLMP